MDENEAYALGRDYAQFGANKLNCHFSIFSKPEYLKSWEDGRSDFKKQK